MAATAPPAKPALRITLSDVAHLARVQRPVVSMWRARSKNTSTPFPAAVDTTGTQELFDADRIVDWLAATGRGNNPHAAEDAAVFATLSGPYAKRTHFTGLTALLTLRCLTDAPLGGQSSNDLLDSADELDPDDAFLFSEIDGLGANLVPLALYTDLLTEAAYSADAAFEQLLADRFRAGASAQSRTALTDEAIDLVAATAVELAAASDRPPVFMDDGGSDFLPRVADMVGESAAATLCVGTDDGDGAARLARRRLVVQGLSRENLRVVDTVVDTVPAAGDTGMTVRVAQFPSPARPDMSAADIVTAIDDIVLGMDRSHAGVVLAPAAFLTDSLAGSLAASELAGIRADVLRSGRVRAIVRLPQGLLKAKPRQAQALWVLGPSYRDVPIADRWTMVADLTGHVLSEDIRQDLVSDLAASMGGRESVRAHAFRFARLVLTRSLLAGSAALTAAAIRRPPAAVPVAPASAPAVDLIRAEQWLGALNEAGQSNLSMTLAPASHPALAPETVGSLMRAGFLKYAPGHRLADADLEPEVPGRAQFPVIGVAELGGARPAGTRRIGQLAFARDYPHGRLTEPGDVVFCTGAQPAAIVDEAGAAVVLYPARILRINATDPGGLVAQVLAQDIRAAPAGSWKQWPLRRVPEDLRVPLARALAEVARERRRAAIRLSRLDALAGMLAGGVAHGSFGIGDLGMTTEGTS
ncbi:hypothetical protein [Specibacter cremeus]|uniref:hypothetical protein n=1 Tax=Specibacter cremeus TaxID=1629051 RepID=UPI001F0B99C8|nr:hypothetical protein [Specibacter cremeus]